MNWAKGRATKGRGTSFKGALVYVLHDKNAQSSERVGFVDLHNLATDDPHRVWREMKALCDAADELKQRSGIEATGRKLTKPVYAFTLNWHEADNPDPAHMRETAMDALHALGMENLQAIIVEHRDRPHKHVHVIVNLVNPETGQAASLSNDAHKLDRWADDYEQTRGVIRSPARRAKFQALDNGIKPPKRPANAKTREEWLATRKLNGEKAKQRAAEIRTAYAAYVARLKAAHGDAAKIRSMEADKLWNVKGTAKS
ncbi:relaxase/mobilization nuclease domain-containing protein [Methylocapsa sp. D3K7]|uniref:relaxase/mobilization nuclease domain-containing protein n=1 Tax=Methylocapsa sp. D3K7 TaxID=3041435 RepID=UPI00244E86E4|nr:relaxase/mobilization nuclease domain-containing protein [Methylocapsa sp. D3K7]WGJ13271.1 relaxase/mobilization nuclease domain-containing protein [Methylocapsa sp. D3K7]